MAVIRSTVWLALFGAAWLLGCTGTEAIASTDLAESALLTVADLPGDGWEVVEVPEAAFIDLNLPVSGRPDDCRHGPPSDPLRVLDRGADERVVLGRWFHREPRSGALVGERIAVAVLAFDSAEDVDAFLADGGFASDGDAEPTLEPCDELVDESSGATAGISDERPALSLADSTGSRTVLTVTEGGTSTSRLLAETHWFVRDRVVAVFTVQSASGGVDYQVLLEEFERRVVAAQE